MRLYNCDIYRFEELISDKTLVCFGAGKMLEHFISDYPEMQLESKISYVVDNMPEKIGSFLQIVGVKIPVIDVKTLLELKNVILLITCNDIYGVYEQLSTYPGLDDLSCFAVKFIRSETNQKEERERRYPLSFRITKDRQIPKKIHYCWFGRKEIPDQNKRWMESWTRLCPDYEIVRWDEDNYDVTKNRYMYEAYKAKKWGFVPDYARLDIIYNHGGIYLDTDVELLKNLDDLLYQPAFSGIDGSKNIALGLGFGAKKELRIIKQICDVYDDLRFIKEDGSFNMIDAPRLLRPYLNSYGYINNGELQMLDGMTVYPEKVLSAKCNYTRRIRPTPYSYAIHHFDCSWALETKYQNIRNIKLLEEAILV